MLRLDEVRARDVDYKAGERWRRGTLGVFAERNGGR